MSVDGPELTPPTGDLYAAKVAQAQRAHRLLSVHWEMTYRCNEECTHCYLDVFKPNATVAGELSTEECLRVVDELADMNVLYVTLSGGELFTRRDWHAVAAHVRSKRMLLRLYTNGILVNAAMADRIAALYPYAVDISLYSTRADVHEAITRRPRSWDLTVRAMRLLVERGVRVTMKSPLMRENVREIDALEAFARDIGATFQYDTTITPKDSGDPGPLRHRMSHEDMVWLFSRDIAPETWLSRQVRDTDRTCGIALAALALDPYGNVFPCVQTRIKAGNVREQSMRAIWETSPVWNTLGNMTVSELPVCRTCELRNLCVRCHGIAKVEHGDLHAPALVNCREALARREAFVRRGVLSADYPIPAHLREYAEGVGASMAMPDAWLPGFVPLTAVDVAA